MSDTNREQHLKRIMTLETRIAGCKRCISQNRCYSKPSLGKGDLKPEILLVFQSEGNRHKEMKNYIEIRQMLKKELAQNKIYHTFMVRCQPNHCWRIDDMEGIVVRNSDDYETQCRFKEPVCEGIPIMPAETEIISCLPYLLEEIDILAPNTIILFGKRTARFGLKAVGILEEPSIPGFYLNNNRRIFTTVEENNFTIEDAKKLAGFITTRQADLA